MTAEEMDRKVWEMVLERQRHDAEIRLRFKDTTVEPMTAEEMDRKIQIMVAERQRQDAAARERYLQSCFNGTPKLTP